MNSSYSYSYKELLKKHNGLLTVNCKLPVKDRTALSFVYTPGVGANCKLIEANQDRAYDLTNKANSMLVVTDCSGFNNIVNQNGTLDFSYPFLEAICVYYKYLANIDAYPILINARDSDDFCEVVKAIMPGFACVELMGVSQDRVMKLDKEISGINSNSDYKPSFSILGGDYKSRKEICQLPIGNITSNTIYAAVIRAAMELKVMRNLNECVSYIASYVLNNSNVNILDLIMKACEFLTLNINMTNKNSLSQKFSNIKSKFLNFQIQGRSAWISEYPNNYLSHTKSINENSILLHLRYKGVIETGCKISPYNITHLNKLLTWENIEQLSKLIANNPELVNKYTCRGNLAAIITNGTAILGYGDIGALSGLPVMEGKCVLFKLFGGTNVIPICIEEKNPEKLISIIEKISPSFCAINLEDIKAPQCFQIESTLINKLPYPVFHDDQHGTAIVVLAGILNAVKLSKRNLGDVKIVMNGAGAAGESVTELLVTNGAKNVIVCDTSGAIYKSRKENMNAFKRKLADITNLNEEKGVLKEIIKDCDIFIGLSVPKTLNKEMIKMMKPNPIIFALANPEPEIYPREAREAGASIIATGRSDFKNQVNNSLAFPGIFRAVIDTRATKISVQMKSAASRAIAGLITNEELNAEYIIPDALDSRVPVAVANAVAREAIESGLAREGGVDQSLVEDNFLGWLLEEKLKNWDNVRKENLEFKGDMLKPKF